ncbi:alpha/beta hydrolase, partial [Bacillus pseudomycoides]
MRKIKREVGNLCYNIIKVSEGKMMKGKKKEIQTNDKAISYTHIEMGSKTIC